MSYFLKSFLPQFDANAELGVSERDIKVHSMSRTAEEPYQLSSESLVQEGVPQGSVTKYTFSNSKIYPGTERKYWVYVPKQYDGTQPANVMVFQDGAMYVSPEANVPTVFDNLIHKGELPVTIGIFVNPGDKGPGLPLWGGTDNRNLEYDALDDRYATFLVEELIPEVEKEYIITTDPEARGICGISSGGICAFNVAWHHPDYFRKVVSHCGSFVNIRGGNNYPSIVRRVAAKPIRVFLQSGENDLNVVFGNWLIANQDMASALEYRRYDYKFIVGEGGHSLKHGAAIFPDTLRWLWRE
ncbi:alpha/beta hydrolase [Radiobacillus sp. PE A8.2]|uniref:alpha/beta hydrolase n=1 Tax=Radiobacillus sp. PE A8.2 TaxID=3380349 RepID=UPI00388D0E10